MNRHKPAPDQDTATTNNISVDYPIGKPRIQSQSNTPKLNQITKKQDVELEAVANLSIN